MDNFGNFKNLGKRVGNLSGLPEDLTRQLQITKTDKLEKQIKNVINDLYNGMANIDEILVGLYRKYELVEKRQFIANKMYRMTKSNSLFSVKGRKGVYTTREELVSYYSSS